MSEKVDPTESNAASILLINAMALLAPDDFQELFDPQYVGGTCSVDVELKVNGVVVPFAESVTNAWNILESSIDKHVKEKALELVSRAKLDKLLYALDNAEWQIENALEKALEE